MPTTLSSGLSRNSITLPGKRSHAAMEDEDEAYEAFLNSLSTNNQVHEYDRDVRNPISEQRIPILQWWCDNER
jgi:hypothetical protein